MFARHLWVVILGFELLFSDFWLYFFVVLCGVSLTSAIICEASDTESEKGPDDAWCFSWNLDFLYMTDYGCS